MTFYRNYLKYITLVDIKFVYTVTLFNSNAKYPQTLKLCFTFTSNQNIFLNKIITLFLIIYTSTL
jgi:lysylphosphatidylglycerol synthetase-like protein (DUF2156 family)